ncbi:MAG: type II toxin-antitoxin system PemK/MazF family toxin [Lachnospiraceae bacterium]|nr:type II toxin-antitoxin system PemK/MazF family toxin [Lachnospiraceae bacterium]MCD7956742.1 type II toxin-antitoxin system PemK/MazF family toxin [Lachnospiraceae bacterium]
MFPISQGDILKVEHLSFPVLVVSRDFFNQSEQIIACPIQRNAAADPLHIPVTWNDMQGIVLCEQLKILDLRVRGYKKTGELKIDSIMDITDAIQSIFDYYPSGRHGS